MGVGSSDNWLFQCLDENDVETLIGAVGMLNEALKKCKDAFTLEMENKKSVFRQNMVNRIAKSLRNLDKKDKKTYKEHKELLNARLGQTWMEVQKKINNLMLQFLEAIGKDFYPIELESWDALVEGIIKAFWIELFRDAVPMPKAFLKAIHRVNKDMIMWCFAYLANTMDGVDLFDLNKEGDNILISAIKSCSEPIKKLNEVKDNLKKNSERKLMPKRTLSRIFARSLSEEGQAERTREAIDVELGADRIDLETGEAFSENTLLEKKIQAEKWQLWIKRLIHLLAQAGAIEDPKMDADAIDQFGWTALMWAVVKEETDIVETLCSTTADIDCRDPCGRTPLHLAVQQCNLEIVNCLLKHGAEVHSKNAFGETPLTLAEKQDNDEIYLALGGDAALDKEKNGGIKREGSNCPTTCF